MTLGVFFCRMCSTAVLSLVSQGKPKEKAILPLSLSPNSLYYVRSCRTVHNKISPLFAVELELLLCSNHYFISTCGKGYMFPSPLSYAMCSFFVFGSGATTKDMMHQWGPCAHEEEVWKT
uniref:Secreted protein n=1 Tax=Oryza sativa subsp. japonica TaxID=39947 RepID=Q75LR9_ORYSJ|nr:hypothetical protein [Oryza sativa Japonica Group]